MGVKSSMEQNAQELVDNVNYGREFHVTTRNDYPYNTWNVEQLAEDAGLFLRSRTTLAIGTREAAASGVTGRFNSPQSLLHIKVFSAAGLQ